MRILALDPGSKRIGVAISDALGVLAKPEGFLAAEPFPAFLEALRTMIRDREVIQIVVGIPRNMDGSYGPAAEKAREFVAVVKTAVPIPVEAWDERLTTVQAQRFLSEKGVRARQQKQRVDAAAAAVLLQSYLDARAMRGGG